MGTDSRNIKSEEFYAFCHEHGISGTATELMVYLETGQFPEITSNRLEQDLLGPSRSELNPDKK